MIRRGEHDGKHHYGRAWLLSRPKVDLSRRPATASIAPNKAIGVIGLMFSLAWIGFTLFIVAEFRDAPLPAMAFAALFPAIGLIMAVTMIRTLVQRLEVTFGHTAVTAVRRGLLGSNNWTLPYSAYQGVLHRQVVVRSKNRTTTYQVIELHHTQADRSIPLYVATGTTMPRDRWEDYSRALKLPALLASGDDILERGHCDLDKSVRELAAAGRIDLDYDDGVPPPPGLLVGTDGVGGDKRLRVRVTAARVPAWAAAMFVGFPGIFIALGIGKPEAWPAAAFGALFVAVFLWTYLKDRRSPRALIITRHEVIAEDAWPWDKSSLDRIALNRVETVRLGRGRSDSGRLLLIEGDRGRIAFGQGLSKAALDWLRDYVTAAIVKA